MVGRVIEKRRVGIGDISTFAAATRSIDHKS